MRKVPSGSPTYGEERSEKGRHLDYCLGRAEHSEDPNQDRSIKHVAPQWRTVEHVFGGRLRTECERGQQVRPDVETQHLEDADREREPSGGQSPDYERCELGDVVGEVIRDEASDVRECAAAMGHRGDNRGEVIVEQYQVRGFARDIGA